MCACAVYKNKTEKNKEIILKLLAGNINNNFYN